MRKFRTIAAKYPSVAFSYVIPTIIAGKPFRPHGPLGDTPIRDCFGLEKEHAARVCVRAVYNGAQFTFMPVWFPNGLYTLYQIVPQVFEFVGLLKLLAIL